MPSSPGNFWFPPSCLCYPPSYVSTGVEVWVEGQIIRKIRTFKNKSFHQFYLFFLQDFIIEIIFFQDFLGNDRIQPQAMNLSNYQTIKIPHHNTILQHNTTTPHLHTTTAPLSLCQHTHIILYVAIQTVQLQLVQSFQPARAKCVFKHLK